MRVYHGYIPSPKRYLGTRGEAFSLEKAAKTRVGDVRVDRGGARKIIARALDLEVLDQGELGTCEAQAWTSGLSMVTESPVPLSRLDLYFKCRTRDGSFPSDAGTMGSTCADVLAGIGICPEWMHPYDGARANRNDALNRTPSEEALQAGYDNRIDAAHRIVSFGAQRGAEVRASIDAGRPVQIGGSVSRQYEDYFRERQASEPNGTRSGLVAFGQMQHPVGGHAQLIVGYWEVAPGVFLYLARNSWGADGGLEEFPGHAYYTAEGLDWCDELFSIFRAPRF